MFTEDRSYTFYYMYSSSSHVSRSKFTRDRVFLTNARGGGDVGGGGTGDSRSMKLLELLLRLDRILFLPFPPPFLRLTRRGDESEDVLMRDTLRLPK